MGCKYACICGGICPGCTRYQPEEYCGHAEDILAQSHGFESDDEYRNQQELERMRLQEEDYNKAVTEEYERWLEEQTDI